MGYLAQNKISVFNKRTNPNYGIGATVQKVVELSSGKILLCGEFNSYGGYNGFNKFVRLNADRSLDMEYTMNASGGGKFNNLVNGITVQADGKVLLHGYFTDYGGTIGRSYLVRLNTDGTVDSTFCSNAVDSGKINQYVLSAVENTTTNRIYVGGAFSRYAGVSGVNFLAVLNMDGTTDSTATSALSGGNKFKGDVATIAVQSDGKTIIAGSFDTYGATANRNYLIRVTTSHALDTSFNSTAVDGAKFGTYAFINFVEINSSGQILVSGYFQKYAGTSGRNQFVRLNSDGTVDTSFTNAVSGSAKLGAYSSMSGSKTQSDGKVLLWGAFRGYGGVSGRSYFGRWNADGTIDSSFCTNAVDGKLLGEYSYMSSFAVLSSSILMAGNIEKYGEETFAGIIEVSSAGVYIPNFGVEAGKTSVIKGAVRKVFAYPNGDLLLAGSFIDYGGVSGRDRLVRVSSDGVVDASFCANASDGGKFNEMIYEIKVDSTGKIYVGGAFSTYGGTSGRDYFIRLNADGSLDTTYTSNSTDGGKFTAAVVCVCIQSDGKLLVGGTFYDYDNFYGVTNLLRLQTDGLLDYTFCSNAVVGKLSGEVRTITVNSSGLILVSAYFYGWNGDYSITGKIVFNSDGTKNATATDNIKSFDGYVEAATYQPDGKLLIGGSFNEPVDNSKNFMRLNADFTKDTAFCANASDGGKFKHTVLVINVSPEGRIFCAGDFYDYDDIIGKDHLIAFNPDGTIDTEFEANAIDNKRFGSKGVLTAVSDPTGNLIVGGAFSGFRLINKKVFPCASNVVKLRQNGKSY